MNLKMYLILFLSVAFILVGCPKDEDDTPDPQAPTEDNASGTFTSDQEGVIETPAGARIYVPEGAVPRQANGQPSTMVFSIESYEDASITPPPGETMDSRLYRLGPEGFVFERQVTVEIPLLDERDPGDMEVNLYRVNPETGLTELFAGDYHADTRTVSAQTYHFSPWFLSCRPLDPEGVGCTWVQNNSVKWVSVCAVPDSLRYPARDAQWIAAEGLQSFWAPWNHNIGVSNSGQMWMPQGWYRICVTYHHQPGDHDTMYTHRWLPDQLVVDNAARPSWNGLHNYDCTTLEIGGDGIGAQYTDGRCDCVPLPTTPVGTGDIQVTLTWFNHLPLDLDLWVMDPDSETCYYGNNPSSSGGVLDRDNLCSNYENGRPENIFWTSSPPNGEYVVIVDWYSDCGNDIPSQSINVRTVVQGTTRTFSRTIQNDERLEVTRFNVTGSTVNFLPARPGGANYTNVIRKEKN